MVLNPTQEERLREIATYLRQVREKKAISIEEVAAKTHIRLRMLKALEELLLEQLPEPVYIQGFIRRYGDFLGLDGSAIAQEFPTESAELTFDASHLLSDARGKKTDINSPETNTDEDTPKSSAISIPSSLLAKGTPLYVACGLIGVVVVGGLLYLFARPRTVESAAQKQNTPVVQQQETAATPSPSSPLASTSASVETTNSQSSPTPTELSQQPQPTPTETTSSQSSPTPTELSQQPQPTPTETTSSQFSPTPTELSQQPQPTPTETTSSQSSPTPTELSAQPTPAETTNAQPGTPVQVTVELQDDSWVRIKTDGKTEFEGILKKGTRQSWTAEKQLIVRSGNAGAVLVSVNQKEAKPLGDLGDVKEVTFTSEEQ